MVKKQKTKTIAIRHKKARRGITLSNKKEENYESDTKDETNPDQAGNDKNLL